MSLEGASDKYEKRRASDQSIVLTFDGDGDDDDDDDDDDDGDGGVDNDDDTLRSKHCFDIGIRAPVLRQV